MAEPKQDWERRADSARHGLRPLRFLLGQWQGSGVDAGQPIQARASGQLLLDSSWLRLHERLMDAAGEPLHEDFTLYRFDPSEEGLRVLHFMERAWCRQYPARIDAQGALHWTTGPAGPRVVLAPHERGWRSTVQLPGDAQPSVSLSYLAAPEATP